MLRTNPSFLSLIENLYEKQARQGDIVLKDISSGDFLFKQLQKVNRIFVIKEGITKCYISEENDKEYIVEFLGEGEILGEIEVIRQIPCLCNIAAVTDVKAYAMSIPFFESLFKNDLLFNNMLIREMAERIVNTSSRASFQQLYTVEHGVAKLLDFESSHGLELSKEDMSAYLGITRRTLNRVLKKMNT